MKRERFENVSYALSEELKNHSQNMMVSCSI